MIQWTEKDIQETKDHFREHYNAELSTEDAIESLNNLTAYVKLLIDWYEEEKAKGNDILCKVDHPDKSPITDSTHNGQ